MNHILSFPSLLLISIFPPISNLQNLTVKLASKKSIRSCIIRAVSASSNGSIDFGGGGGGAVAEVLACPWVPLAPPRLLLGHFLLLPRLKLCI